MTENISVKQIFLEFKEQLSITDIIENNGIENIIQSYRIQKTALGITGLTKFVHNGRIQIFGNSEVSYINQLTHDEQIRNLEKLFQEVKIPCIVLTNNLYYPESVKFLANKYNITLIRTDYKTDSFIDIITEFLYDEFSPETSIYGTLLDVYGIGLLLIGKSGIGKSETALELIKRGHRFVVDDIVKVKKVSHNTIYGYTKDIIRNYLEIRGLGVINIKDLFGVTSIKSKKKIELIVELVDWSLQDNYDRIGIEDHFYHILDIPIPYLKLPLRQGRDIATIVEVSARNELAKLQGFNGARSFHKKLIEEISKNEKNFGDLE